MIRDQQKYCILLVSSHSYRSFHIENGAVTNRDYHTEIARNILILSFSMLSIIRGWRLLKSLLTGELWYILYCYILA